MAASAATFMDWQQLDAERQLLVDEEFSWSELPTRRRRRETPRRDSVGARADRSSAEVDEDFVSDASERAAGVEAEFERTRSRWSEEYGRAVVADPRERSDRHQHGEFDAVPETAAAPVYSDPAAEMFDLSEAGRRTVVITGKGDERYMPALTRRRAQGLSLHERAAFNPDRTAMWAFLLGLAVLIGCFAH